MLLLAPGLGIVDNWLPILAAARQRFPHWRILGLAPDADTLAQVDPDDTAQRLLDDVLDGVMFPSPDGAWWRAPDLLAAAQATTPRAATAFVVRLLDALRARPAIPDLVARSAQRIGVRLLQTLHRPDLAGCDGPLRLDTLDPATTLLLYDLHLHDKPRLRPLLAQLAAVDRISLHHGIALVGSDDRLVRSPDPDREVAALLYGDDEVAPYADGFGVSRDRLHVVGVPRHEPGWLAHVQAASQARHDVPWDDVVLVISRPGDSSYLPADRKARLLRELHQVAWEEHGLRLVLRLHPKELEEGAVMAALPAALEGVSWRRTRAHPFHVAQHARLAVTFFSGVALDLVALGVPVVELLDVRGLAAHDHPGAPRDARGRPMFGPYRRDGQVLPADDAADLRAALTRITADRTGIVAELQAAAARGFAPAQGSVERALDVIASRSATAGR